MSWDKNLWGEGGGDYNASGIAPDGTIDPLRKQVAMFAHLMPNMTRENADEIYQDMKAKGFKGMKDGGVVRGVGCAVRGHGKGKMV